MNNAWMLRSLLLLRLVFSAAVLAFCWQGGRPGLGVLLALLLFFAYPIVLLPNFLALRWINRGRGAGHAQAPSWAQLLRAWWRELPVSEHVLSGLLPFAEHAVPDFLPANAATRRGVLLVHGFACNRGLWAAWMRRLQAEGHPCMALSLEPLFGSIDHYAEPIEAAVQRLSAACGGQAPVLVGHSMGGMAIRAWWRRHGGPDRVRRVMTLGTPHGGTLLAQFSPATNARQMRPDSPWLRELAAQEAAELGAQFDCYFSRCDQMVCPAQTAVLPGSQAMELQAIGHLAMVFEPRVLDDLLQLLLRPEHEKTP
ncbi:pimeloyl-ACP methyl ester carboxylesterase [Paucibacter oligotrophus]|uniref:Pimeloyl-ACP methyl ester carboxylesterase n=1 Tax=Roseateles oligotrophus TaxID=1769250 RepID=A0A840LJQ7_9BURK|nr:alpha/beta fold hydrolase [Roseateles oligotrophus]MBB4845517.1 pimeloyl-ACP methyl ester carboxylesterase [Roseateles oligotrophus]